MESIIPLQFPETQGSASCPCELWEQYHLTWSLNAGAGTCITIHKRHKSAEKHPAQLKLCWKTEPGRCTGLPPSAEKLPVPPKADEKGLQTLTEHHSISRWSGKILEQMAIPESRSGTWAPLNSEGGGYGAQRGRFKWPIHFENKIWLLQRS